MPKTETLVHVAFMVSGVVKVTDLGSEDAEHSVLKQEVLGVRLLPPDVFTGSVQLPPESVLSVPLLVARAMIKQMEEIVSKRVQEVENPSGGATQPPGAA